MLVAIAFCGSLFTSAADAKAAQIAAAMTPAERLVLVRGQSGDRVRNGVPTGAIGSAGFVSGVPRLGVPALQETDASLGIANPDNVRRGDVATAMPSGLSLASMRKDLVLFFPRRIAPRYANSSKTRKAIQSSRT